ncbi:MAG: hypothetical protein K0R39_4493 [Symbiobacteriaceae bacterium]|jgi:hypothetical protein|nr:hypothetical protein [Symbiobacteriaceae bacterium]
MIHRGAISPDGSVFSEQTLLLGDVVLRASTTALLAITPDHACMAGPLYWDFLRRFGRPVLRVAEQPSGAIDISLPGLRLLSFDTPQVVALNGGWALRCPINGGAAVDPRHAREGCLQMGLTPDAVSLRVEGYYPNLIRLHTRIYEWTQSALHVRVAQGYLPLLARRLLQEADRT